MSTQTLATVAVITPSDINNSNLSNTIILKTKIEMRNFINKSLFLIKY